ncbi:hypothetical protein NW072_01195 [Mycoplasmopsis felis]|nr:hypothetical protein [Mycoplasmopsis felis]UWV79795.1 hypothetical protein NW072_01195 [Mycoplasmopsis felis]
MLIKSSRFRLVLLVIKYWLLEENTLFSWFIKSFKFDLFITSLFTK